MKKHYYLLGITSLAISLTIPAVIHSQTLMDTGAATSIGASRDDGRSTSSAAYIRDRIITDIKAKDTNIKANQSVRNSTLENHVMKLATTSSTTPALDRASGQSNRAPGQLMKGGQASTTDSDTSRRFNASTTNLGNEGTKNLPNVRRDVFDQQKTNLISQLNQALANLKQVRARIAERITKDQGTGANMANAKALLVTADAKLAAAKAAINALNNLKPIAATTTDTVTSPTIDASTTANPPIVDLGKPRQVGAAAIKAVNDAQKALNAVVVAIAHSLGVKVSQDGTIVATSTATTTTP